TLKEIDRAHAMGIEVFVLDAGWFKKTGDWAVNKEFFPDDLKQVRAKLNNYGMKLGLWFNPTVAALSSDMYQRNVSNRMSWNGKYGEPHAIWETEESVGLCLVSPYWEDFANKLIQLTKELGVSYFKWDAIGQYGCNDAHHEHGTEANSLQERTERYAFLQPQYMAKIIDKVCAEAPQSIFDFDITEDGRCVGLQFLSAGKYFIINNGPYYHNFDLAPMWKSVLPSGNVNIFVEPGPARGWFVRSVLDYDKWIPSVLFLTHYQPDEPRNSQIINIGSLILGQNGIWGELLKTTEKGVALFDTVISKYKTIREDITAAQLVQSGEPGGSPEIYEKINPATGKGCVVIFANARGHYTYITKHKAAAQYWHNEEVELKQDAQGRTVITTQFHEPSAKIILFGVP
ncbi:MAG: alpha-galactosidase, partial [Flavisolibacter sp.]|nr:alpha-galactosidase [Flavisolibacter sp.]